jgi:hypothetical protein
VDAVSVVLVMAGQRSQIPSFLAEIRLALSFVSKVCLEPACEQAQAVSASRAVPLRRMRGHLA